MLRNAQTNVFIGFTYFGTKKTNILSTTFTMAFIKQIWITNETIQNTCSSKMCHRKTHAHSRLTIKVQRNRPLFTHTKYLQCGSKEVEIYWTKKLWYFLSSVTSKSLKWMCVLIRTKLNANWIHTDGRRSGRVRWMSNTNVNYKRKRANAKNAHTILRSNFVIIFFFSLVFVCIFDRRLCAMHTFLERAMRPQRSMSWAKRVALVVSVCVLISYATLDALLFV